jgi:hypothetical protein
LAALGSLYLLWSTSGNDSPDEKPTTQYGNSDSSRRSRSSEHRPAIIYTTGRDAAGNALGIRSESPEITHPGSDYHQDDGPQDPPADQPTAGRHRIRRFLTAAGNRLGDVAHEKLDPDHDRKNDETDKFPEVPGENLRNPDLEHISRTFSRLREERANSTYSASVVSTPGLESPPPPSHDSSRPETSPARRPKRRDTLEVPKEVHRRSESH